VTVITWFGLVDERGMVALRINAWRSWISELERLNDIEINFLVRSFRANSGSEYSIEFDICKPPGRFCIVL